MDTTGTSAMGRDAVRAEAERALRAHAPEHADRVLERFDRALAGGALEDASDVLWMLDRSFRASFPDRAEELSAWAWVLLRFPAFEREVPGVDPRVFRFFHEVYLYYPEAVRAAGIAPWNARALSRRAPESWSEFILHADRTFWTRSMLDDSTDKVEECLVRDDSGIVLRCADDRKQRDYDRYRALAPANRRRVLEFVKTLWGSASG